MPKYHFHLEAGAGPTADTDGRDLADDALAIAEATHAAVETLTEELDMGKLQARAIVRLERSDGARVAVGKVEADVTIVN